MWVSVPVCEVSDLNMRRSDAPGPFIIIHFCLKHGYLQLEQCFIPVR